MGGKRSCGRGSFLEVLRMISGFNTSRQSYLFSYKDGR